MNRPIGFENKGLQARTLSTMAKPLRIPNTSGPHDNTPVFKRISENLAAQGYSFIDDAIPGDLANVLLARVTELKSNDFSPAGIGRADNQMLNNFVRRDEIRWLEHNDEAEHRWLQWTELLRIYLNRHLFLGLFSYESHFAHYEPGAFYKRHVDAFRGDSNRVLSVVLYLNRGWQTEDGGELLMYHENETEPFTRVIPRMGKLAVFLSEEFPHEVLPAKRDRYSIAGWFRVNTSTTERPDPPR